MTGKIETCTVCGKPKDNHPFRHAFASTFTGNTLKAAPKEEPEDSTPSRDIQLGGDPVLRLALIRRGIITPDDLSCIEQELKGAGIAVSNTAVGEPRNR